LIALTETGHHFVYIESFVGLFRKPGHITKDICRYCLHAFNDSLEVHVQFCAALGRQQTTFPINKFMQFQSYDKTQYQPFTIFADFESNLYKIREEHGNTVRTQRHVAVGFAYVVVDWNRRMVAFNK